MKHKNNYKDKSVQMYESMNKKQLRELATLPRTNHPVYVKEIITPKSKSKKIRELYYLIEKEYMSLLWMPISDAKKEIPKIRKGSQNWAKMADEFKPQWSSDLDDTDRSWWDAYYKKQGGRVIFDDWVKQYREQMRNQSKVYKQIANGLESYLN